MDTKSIIDNFWSRGPSWCVDEGPKEKTPLTNAPHHLIRPHLRTNKNLQKRLKSHRRLLFFLTNLMPYLYSSDQNTSLIEFSVSFYIPKGKYSESETTGSYMLEFSGFLSSYNVHRLCKFLRNTSIWVSKSWISGWFDTEWHILYNKVENREN